MSLDAHPNINASGLVADLFQAIEKRVRGNAEQAGRVMWIPEVGDAISEFSVKISEILDNKFGR